MVNPIAWIDAGRDLTYEEAKALAASLGGRLLVFSYDPSVFIQLRDVMDREEDRVILDASSTVPTSTTARQLLVEYLSPSTVLGLGGDDRFVGGPFERLTLRAGDGDDRYVGGPGGGKIDMGSGNDSVYLGELEGVPWAAGPVTPGTTIIDGAGQDVIHAEGAVIQATIDGDADDFQQAARLSYAAATSGLTIAGGLVSGGGVGADIIGDGVVEVVGGSGNDTISGIRRIQGGAGNDVLTPIAYAEGGAGNDELIANSAERVDLRTEAGNDTVRFVTAAKASGGAGVDTFVFESAAAVTLQDFQAGETLDLTALTSLSAQELFAGGYLRVTRAGGYTQLLWDADGGGDDYAAFLTLKGQYSQQVLQSAIVTGPPVEVVEAYFTSAVPVYGAIVRVSTDANGGEANGASSSSSFSNDGLSIVFSSSASNLVAGDTNEGSDIFIKSLVTGAVQRLSTSTSGEQADGESSGSQLSADGRYVVFASYAMNLTSDDVGLSANIFRKDLATGEVVLVSTNSSGQASQQEFRGAYDPKISADGRYVAFTSAASDLLPDDMNGADDVFRKDLQTGELIRVSADESGVGPGFSYIHDISADGHYVMFATTNGFDPADTNGLTDLYVRDLDTGALVLASSSAAGTGGNNVSYGGAMTPDGKYVVFFSPAGNLVPNDANGSVYDVFRKNLFDGSIELVSTSSAGIQASGDSVSAYGISQDGRYVVFGSVAPDLVEDDTEGSYDLFRKDMLTGEIVRLTVDSLGRRGTEAIGDITIHALSSDGRLVALHGEDNLVPEDTNDVLDIFVIDVSKVVTRFAEANVVLETAPDPALATDAVIDWTAVGGGVISVPVPAGQTMIRVGDGLDNGLSGAVTYAVSQGGGQTTGSLQVLSTVADNLPSRVSTGNGEVQADSDSGSPSLSADGRYLLFRSSADNLTPGDIDPWGNVFRKDVMTGQLIEASTNGLGESTNSETILPFISDNGRYVLFSSAANNMLVGDDPTHFDVFRKDLATGEVALVSSNAGNSAANGGPSFSTDFTGDGGYAIFDSLANNLAATDTNGQSDVFHKDLTTGAIVRVSTDSGGAEGNGLSRNGVVSEDGRYVAFVSEASNLVSGDNNGVSDIFRKDLVTGETVLVSASANGVAGDGDSRSRPGISADGRYVVFTSSASNLVAGDTNGVSDAFLKDMVTGSITLLSRAANGGPANGRTAEINFSPNGRYVTLVSDASNLVAGDNNRQSDVFRLDLQTGELIVASIGTDGVAIGGESGVALSDGGVVFASESATVVAGDTNAVHDIFLLRPDLASIATGGAGAELLRGGAYVDTLSGGGGRDLLQGNLSNDILDGGEGADELDGGAGDDLLTGGAGADRFILAEPGIGVDTITDFVAGLDELAIFTANFGDRIAPGDAGDYFIAASNPFAEPLTDRAAFLYDQDDGRLWFDPDGSGSAAAIALAVLDGAPALTADDLLLLG